MLEEKNLPEDTNQEEPFDQLFTDEMEEQDTNVSETDSVSNEKETKEVSAENDEPKYKVNFLGEEKELPVSELVTLSQKGMNYDHVKYELDALKEKNVQYSQTYEVIEQLAAASNMNVKQYVDLCNKTLQENKINQQVSQGVPEAVAKRLLELEQKENIRSRQEERAAAEQQRQDMYQELIREYPDVKQLPDEVIQAIASGIRPLEAYRAYENRKLKNELAILKKSVENRQKSTGSLQGDAPEETDDFLVGFNSI